MHKRRGSAHAQEMMHGRMASMKITGEEVEGLWKYTHFKGSGAQGLRSSGVVMVRNDRKMFEVRKNELV